MDGMGRCRHCGRLVESDTLTPQGKCRDHVECGRARLRRLAVEPPPAGSWGPPGPEGPVQQKLF